MHQTNNRSVAGAHGKARGGRFFSGDLPARLAALRIVISMALISGIMLSLNLWFPARRSFPRVPVITFLPQTIVPTVEYLLSGLLVITLAAVIFAKNTARYLILAIGLLVFLVLLDQMRLQPWVYQYLLLFIVIALQNRQGRDEQSTRLYFSILQLIVATLYFWSGVQKLNYSFGHEVLPQLLTPLQSYLPLNESRWSLLGLGIAFVEIFTGCGLLVKQTRRLCIWLAIAMHGVLLGLLIGEGRNSIVWVWNAALMITIIVLFWGSSATIWQTFATWRASNRFGQAARIFAVVCALLPVLSFWGWWDMYLSGALYSGSTPVAVVRVDQRVYEKLPETVKQQVFTTRNSEQMLPVFEWSMAELNVPPYPERRVFRQLARQVCKLAEDKSDVELVVKERPAILDGSYQVTRTSCAQLEQ